VVTGSFCGPVQIWDVISGKARSVLPCVLSDLPPLAFSPSGNELASALPSATGEGARVCVWDVTAGQVKYTLNCNSTAITSLSFSPDGTKLATGIAHGDVLLWDIAKGQVIHTLRGHSGKVQTLIFLKTGNKLASGSAGDMTIGIWDLTTGQAEHMLSGHPGSIRYLSDLDAVDLENLLLVDGTTSWVMKNGRRILHLPVIHRPYHDGGSDWRQP
jgi:WD40 repeat protein